jgi:hypothetical protein
MVLDKSEFIQLPDRYTLFDVGFRHESCEIQVQNRDTDTYNPTYSETLKLSELG